MLFSNKEILIIYKKEIVINKVLYTKFIKKVLIVRVQDLILIKINKIISKI